MDEKRFLPRFESEDQREAYYATKSKEKFTDERKHYFTENEVNELARESSMSGGEILALDSIVTLVQTLVKKGTGEAVIVEIPQTTGTDELKNVRRVNDTKVRKGYEVKEQTVYGFVDDERGTMRYFTEDGDEVVERERSLSAKEKREYLGLFAALAKAPEEETFMKATGTDDDKF